jgi:hypothetical protein
VQLIFNVNGKPKRVHLRQSFMSTQALHNIVKETDEIMLLLAKELGKGIMASKSYEIF